MTAYSRPAANKTPERIETTPEWRMTSCVLSGACGQGPEVPGARNEGEVYIYIERERETS